jgi:cysteine desulfurase
VPGVRSRLYLDHNATTPVDPDVIAAVTEAMRDEFGNASSVHHFGQRAKALLDDARQQVASLIGGSPAEVVFTSGGTESDNFALRGVAEALEPLGKKHLVVSLIEHEAVLTTARALERRGWRITRVAPDSTGVVSPSDVEAALAGDTALLSLMHANNEIGTLQPVAECAALARARGILVHTDAVQSVGKVRVDVQQLGVDLLSLSGHKLYGPKGVGALWIRRGTRLLSPMTGGKQERSRRAGTENAPGIVGLGKACQLAREAFDIELGQVAALRDRLEKALIEAIPSCFVTGNPENRLPNTANIAFEYIEGEAILLLMNEYGIAASSGSACTSGSLEPSHVMRAMGVPYTAAHGATRFSLSRDTTQAEIDKVIEVMPGIIERLRKLSPYWTNQGASTAFQPVYS